MENAPVAWRATFGIDTRPWQDLVDALEAKLDNWQGVLDPIDDERFFEIFPLDEVRDDD